jgi:5'-methylthioadenosine phosphorylase
MTAPKLGIIGGSGVYDVAGIENAEWTTVDTPWGAPSDAIRTGVLGGVDVAFLPRHGRGHVHSPADVPYRANIAALKTLVVTDIVALSACGSFREDMAPGDFVMVDQFIDRTIARPKSFFGTGCVAHVSVAHPTCKRLSAIAEQAVQSTGITVHKTGTYLAMEGPQFSTLAESRMYRDVWNCDVIGMTNMPEAKLAREAEICYAPIAMVTDFDSWHPDHDDVDVAQVIAVMHANATAAKATVVALPNILGTENRTPCPYGCDHALENAIITAPEHRDTDLVQMLKAIAGRVLA